MSKAKKRSREKFVGRRQQEPVEPEASHEIRAIDPARSFDDWEEWLRIAPRKDSYL